MDTDNDRRQIAALVFSLVLAFALGLLFLYIRQRLFTQAEPIVLAT